MKEHVRRKTCKRDDRPRTMCILRTDLNRFFVCNCLYIDTEMKVLCNKTLTIYMSPFLVYIFAYVLL
jgi:hypothetical protein